MEGGMHKAVTMEEASKTQATEKLRRDKQLMKDDICHSEKNHNTT